MNELIEWHACSDVLPDDACTVLCAWPDADVWPGYRDGETWRDLSAMPMSDAPRWWAQLPEGPL